MAIAAHRPDQSLIEAEDTPARSPDGQVSGSAVDTETGGAEKPAMSSAGAGTTDSAGTGPEAETSEPGATVRLRPPPPQGSRIPRWLVPSAIALSATLVVLLVLAVFSAADAVSGFRLERGRADALSAGRQAAVNLTTFDFATAEADVQRLKDSTTAKFEGGFASDRDAFVKSLRDTKIKMTSNVTEAGLLTYAGNAAHVMVAIKSQVSNAQVPQPVARDYRMDVSMIYQNGLWLADGVEFVS